MRATGRAGRTTKDTKIAKIGPFVTFVVDIRDLRGFVVRKRVFWVHCGTFGRTHDGQEPLRRSSRLSEGRRGNRRCGARPRFGRVGRSGAFASRRQGPAPRQPPSAAREADPAVDVDALTTDRPGGDFMVDVLKSLNIDYIASNPGSSFRGIHESIINYGGNKMPEFLTCCHEESSVAMAHAYFKVEGKPMAVLCHGTVGLQHAAMAIYNAYCDRVPVYILAGNSLDATMRRPGVEWAHSVQDAASMVRDFIKWDDNPVSLPHFAESAVRAYKIAMTPPMMPVVVVIDGGLQEDPIPHRDRLAACGCRS